MKNFESLEFDTFSPSGRELKVYFVGHGSLMFDYSGYVIHVDPVSDFADYASMPKADLILITHQHYDHLEQKAIGAVSEKNPVILIDPEGASMLGRGTVMKNGDKANPVPGISVRAVPAYNISADRVQFHPKGRDNGYIISFDGLSVYIAGDTEPIPEMAELGHIDIAFLPMNQPYTMTPAQVLQAADMIKPEILYPYHFGTTDTSILVRLMESSPTEVRIRSLA